MQRGGYHHWNDETCSVCGAKMACEICGEKLEKRPQRAMHQSQIQEITRDGYLPSRLPEVAAGETAEVALRKWHAQICVHPGATEWLLCDACFLDAHKDLVAVASSAMFTGIQIRLEEAMVGARRYDVKFLEMDHAAKWKYACDCTLPLITKRFGIAEADLQPRLRELESSWMRP
jgi:hypothetical protein